MEANTPAEVKSLPLYAWVGEDELGSGQVGLKMGLVPAGYIPLVSVRAGRLDQPDILGQLQAQANTYRKTIRLCKFEFVQEIVTIEPDL